MLTVANTTKWLQLFTDQVNTNQDALNQYDTPIGDGDHGSNLARGTTAMMDSLNKADLKSVSDVWKTAAMAIISKVGGAAGPLYGTAFLEMAKASKDRPADDIAVQPLIDASLKGLLKRGGAVPGDKTMVDVWTDVDADLEKGPLTSDQVKTAVESTKPMEAKKGRASYLGKDSVGHLDPGSVSSGFFFESLIQEGEIQ
ncbi:dihydroxyacetone kinase, l subunit [Lactobacillus selangorensis]|uniref:phosphoenolpyruvate--glycerone phosphotransferase n=1 Tax=Lactobacillus selangorensis TaxID=81857 RepID=A0A0R2G058_9LACO|nr:dihydroxyacetone kinase subunit DhaL [Lactobacillus selangorensis]KRN29278.1 dihydroxyacetone kinase, l subunit [Lactobacillus selangorensis]KRN34193.1 dihydroxyacetone kinase, l subunit [Lactobacillus selangorensis]